MSEVPQSEEDIKGSAAQAKGETPRLEAFQPGDVIKLANVAELAAFEDMIAGVVEPNYDPELWAARAKLRDLIRPPKFNGTIANIELTVMDDPYERLLDAPDRDWSNASGKANTLSLKNAEGFAPRYKGFILTADARSSGRGSIGSIQAEMWYAPLIGKKDKDSANYRRLRDSYGRTINRVVTKPKIQAEKFEAVNKESRKIGFDQLRKGMMNPISAPMRD